LRLIIVAIFYKFDMLMTMIFLVYIFIVAYGICTTVI
jgi:hypothetical protein